MIDVRWTWGNELMSRLKKAEEPAVREGERQLDLHLRTSERLRNLQHLLLLEAKVRNKTTLVKSPFRRKKASSVPTQPETCPSSPTWAEDSRREFFMKMNPLGYQGHEC